MNRTERLGALVLVLALALVVTAPNGLVVVIAGAIGTVGLVLSGLCEDAPAGRYKRTREWRDRPDRRQ